MGVPQTNRTETHPNARLTREQAYEIKFKRGGQTRYDLATKFNVSYQTINNIIWGVTWSWLKPKPEDIQLELPSNKSMNIQ